MSLEGQTHQLCSSY